MATGRPVGRRRGAALTQPAPEFGGRDCQQLEHTLDHRRLLRLECPACFLVVPALTLLAGLEVHAAVGTSRLVIAANSAAGILAHLRQGEMPLGLTAAFTAAAAALAGVRLAASLDPGRLRRAFAVFVVLVGLFLLAKNALAA